MCVSRYGRIRRVRRVAVVSILAAACCAAARAGVGPPVAAPWHLPEWRYRQVVELLTRDASATINTGLIRLEAVPPMVAGDGRDVRVLDEVGQPVRFQIVDERGAERTKPIEAAQPAFIHFEVPPKADRFYFVYFGNPDADSAQADWTKRLGGLTLETRPNPQRRPAVNFRQLQRLLTGNANVFGSGDRRQINDPANPFGPSDFYIGIYKGFIYCPADGSYAFGTDSDDSSFLLVDGRLVVQWPGGHNPAGTFKHQGSVKLTAGVHRIEYYHVQSGGGALARAGWRPPGASEMEIIPPEAFLRELRTRTVVVSRRDSPLSVFFGADIRHAFRFGSDGPVVMRVAFRDLSSSLAGPVAWRMWEFGDEGISTEADPVHTFVGAPQRMVQLRCMDSLGFEGSWQRLVHTDPTALRQVDLPLQIVPPEHLLEPGEPLRVVVKCSQQGAGRLDVTLTVDVALQDGPVVERWREPLSLEEPQWERRTYQFAEIRGVPFDVGRVEFGLNYMGHPVQREILALRRADDRELVLDAVGDRLVNRDGAQVVLRLSDTTYARKRARAAERLRKKEPVTVLFVDDALAGTSEQSYIRLFRAMLETAAGGASVTCIRTGHEEQPGRAYVPFQSAVNVARVASEVQPDLVVLAASLRDIVRFEPVERYERTLRAIVDRLQAVAGCELVLLAPPPVIGNPGFGQAYAIATKRVGLLKGLRVADGYSAFMRAAERRCAEAGAGSGTHDWRRFYREADSTVPI